MIEKTLARRYAAALLRATEAEGSTEQTEQLLRALREAYRTDRAFRALLSQPKISRFRKKELLRKPFEGRASRAFLEFLGLLIDKNRQDIIPDVAEVYDLLADAAKGEVRIQVRVWRPLTEEQRRRLKEGMQRLAERKVLLEEQTDPSILGGVLARVGFTVVSGTVRYRLGELGERLRELQRR